VVLTLCSPTQLATALSLFLCPLPTTHTTFAGTSWVVWSTRWSCVQPAQASVACSSWALAQSQRPAATRWQQTLSMTAYAGHWLPHTCHQVWSQHCRWVGVHMFARGVANCAVQLCAGKLWLMAYTGHWVLDGNVSIRLKVGVRSQHYQLTRPAHTNPLWHISGVAGGGGGRICQVIRCAHMCWCGLKCGVYEG
jgi:hypothetical protein